MNKTQLKDFAVNSRNKLRQDVYSRLKMFEIDESGINEPTLSTNDLITFSNGFRLEGQDAIKYNNLKNHLNIITKDKKFEETLDDFVEEVAYTWFNRIIAIRFMEVNNYMPHGYRVLSSSEEGVLEPELLRNYTYLDIGLTNDDLDKLDDLSLSGDVHSQNKMFELLFLKQCHALNEALPELFEKTEDFKDLLLILSFTDPQSVVYNIVNEVSEASFDINSKDGSGQIEIIGWLYQYYNSEKKDAVFKKSSKEKIKSNEVPAATQLFTPQWIVKYMVENTLGRLWIEHLIANGDIRTEIEIADYFKWKYYVPEAAQDDIIHKELDELRQERKTLKLEEITFMDPAMGSYHIGVYAFDVFMQLYESQGYNPRDAAIKIIENNLYGIDIDKRAYQLGYFALMMKGMEYNRRIFYISLKINLINIEESNELNSSKLDVLRYKNKEELEYVIDIFRNAKDTGSILKLKTLNWNNLFNSINVKNEQPLDIESLETKRMNEKIVRLIKQGSIISNQYNILITNPPYMSSRTMNLKLSEYIGKHYKDTRMDMFSVFIELCKNMTVDNGYFSLITQHSWMFLSSFLNFRLMLSNVSLKNMLHLGTRAFNDISGEVVQTTSFVYMKKTLKNYNSTFFDLTKPNDSDKKEISFLNKENKYINNKNNFKTIPGTPIAYWASNSMISIFEKSEPLSKFVIPRNGMKTGNNNMFLRLWWEVSTNDVNYKNITNEYSNKKWFAYNKGGIYRKWYGNNDYIVDWEHEGRRIFGNAKKDRRNVQDYPNELKFKPSGSWSLITSGQPSFRYKEGNLSDIAGMSFFGDKSKVLALIGFSNSIISKKILKMIAPTINYQAGDIGRLPILENIFKDKNIINVVNENIIMSKEDWDLSEVSWGYLTNVFITYSHLLKLESIFGKIKTSINNNFENLKNNEIFLNKKFIELYEIKELDHTVSDRDITITKIFDNKDDIYDEIKGNRYIKTKEDIIKEFMSYAVGCMMGRYSLDEEGLIYAGGEWDYSRYDKFKPQKDNILIISNESGIENDIVDRFVEFVRVAFGDETLEENLTFISDCLYANGTVRDRIRRYFNNDFYKNHVQMYKKTPIYWLYDSGSGKTKRQQENAFKALIYVHRYDGNTTGNVRINHLHEIQARYEREFSILQSELLSEDLDAKARRENQNRIDVLERKIKEIKDYDEDIAHIAIENIETDLDDGIKVNHEKVQTDRNGKVYNILSKI